MHISVFGFIPGQRLYYRERTSRFPVNTTHPRPVTNIGDCLFNKKFPHLGFEPNPLRENSQTSEFRVRVLVHSATDAAYIEGRTYKWG